MNSSGLIINYVRPTFLSNYKKHECPLRIHHSEFTVMASFEFGGKALRLAKDDVIETTLGTGHLVGEGKTRFSGDVIFEQSHGKPHQKIHKLVSSH